MEFWVAVFEFLAAAILLTQSFSFFKKSYDVAISDIPEKLVVN